MVQFSLDCHNVLYKYKNKWLPWEVERCSLYISAGWCGRGSNVSSCAPERGGGEEEWGEGRGQEKPVL